MNMTLFGNRVFADVIKMLIKMRSHWSRTSPYSKVTIVLVREKRGRDRHEGERQVAIGAGPERCSSSQGTLSTEDHDLRLGRSRKGPSLRFQRKQPCRHLDFGHLTSRTVK